jgi:hypothetical protein
MITFKTPNKIYASLLQTTKQVIKMAEAQALLSFLKILLGSYYGYILLDNFYNIKGWMLTALALTAGIVHIYFKIKKGKQALREKEYQLWEMEREKRKRDRAEIQS